MHNCCGRLCYNYHKYTSWFHCELICLDNPEESMKDSYLLQMLQVNFFIPLWINLCADNAGSWWKLCYKYHKNTSSLHMHELICLNLCVVNLHVQVKALSLISAWNFSPLCINLCFKSLLWCLYTLLQLSHLYFCIESDLHCFVAHDLFLWTSLFKSLLETVTMCWKN